MYYCSRELRFKNFFFRSLFRKFASFYSRNFKTRETILYTYCIQKDSKLVLLNETDAILSANFSRFSFSSWIKRKILYYEI